MTCRDLAERGTELLLTRVGQVSVEEIGAQTIVSKSLLDYYKCPEHYSRVAASAGLSGPKGYFRFGKDAVCYGRYSGGSVSHSPANPLPDALQEATSNHGTTYLPFDLTEVLENLRHEVYVGNWREGYATSTLARIYYLFRPLIPFGLRSYLKKLHLKGRDELPFPRWPVDCSVDSLLEQLLVMSVRSNGNREIPFIWFWPEGASSCAIMTHDVETEAGKNFCPHLMDIDDSFGVKASFQVIPEERYCVSAEFLASLQDRGFEVVVHDLNHDGHLYRDREQFLRRMAKINLYRQQYGAEGFRAAVLYRKQTWFDALEFSYDMSVPNVAHLDPQHGGCCTVMPYFIGNIVELPVTTTQDYMLFHVLNDYTTGLWKQQTKLIMEKHGLMSFIVHPDYIMGTREKNVYRELLAHLAELREKKNVWITTPGEVNRWWRHRAEMTIVEDGEDLRIEGPGSERARIAYASENGGRLVLSLQPSSAAQVSSQG